MGDEQIGSEVAELTVFKVKFVLNYYGGKSIDGFGY